MDIRNARPPRINEAVHNGRWRNDRLTRGGCGVPCSEPDSAATPARTALRRLRETAGLTGDQVIERIGWASASKLSRLENGRSRPDLGDVLDLLDLYGVDGESRNELIAITRDAGNTRAWLRATR